MSIPDLETYLPKVISWRRDLHMHPELGLQEVRTSNLIADLLTKFGLDVQRNFAGTAVLGTLHTNKTWQNSCPARRYGRTSNPRCQRCTLPLTNFRCLSCLRP